MSVPIFSYVSFLVCLELVAVLLSPSSMAQRTPVSRQRPCLDNTTPHKLYTLLTVSGHVMLC